MANTCRWAMYAFKLSQRCEQGVINAVLYPSSKCRMAAHLKESLAAAH